MTGKSPSNRQPPLLTKVLALPRQVFFDYPWRQGGGANIADWFHSSNCMEANPMNARNCVIAALILVSGIFVGTGADDGYDSWVGESVLPIKKDYQVSGQFQGKLSSPIASDVKFFSFINRPNSDSGTGRSRRKAVYPRRPERRLGGKRLDFVLVRGRSDSLRSYPAGQSKGYMGAILAR